MEPPVHNAMTEHAIEVAEGATQRGDWPEAVRLWHVVLEGLGDKAPPKVFLQLGRAYRELGQLKEAEAVLLDGRTKHPKIVGLAYELARIASESQDWPEAAKRWESLLDSFGDRAPAGAYLRLSATYRALGQSVAAEAVLQKGRSHYPEHIGLNTAFAELATARQDWPEAAKRWQAVLALADQDAPVEVYARLCRALRLGGRAGEARLLASHALTTYPRDVRLLCERALCDDPDDDPLSVDGVLTTMRDVKPEIVVCVHNALEAVINCINSIQINTKVPFFLTIVDDFSDAIVRQYLENFVSTKPFARLITNSQNIGYTRSANRGLREARSDWVVLLNSDTVVTPSWLEGLIECARSGPKVGAVGPLSNAATFQSVPETRSADGSFVVNNLPDGMTPEGAAEIVRNASNRAFPRVPMLNGFCLLLNCRALQDVGFLDEVSFPVGFGEENDLCLRLISAGYQLAIADHVYVFHSKSSSFGNERRKSITEQSVKSLRNKWPGYSYKYIAEAIKTLHYMNSLRSRLRIDLREQII